MIEPLIELCNVSIFYGSIQATDDVSFCVFPGEIVALLGANGAGKSSLLRGISGLIPVRTGSIHYQGKPIAGVRPERLVVDGLSHVPEGRGIFLNLTVSENLDLGAWTAPKSARLADDLERMFQLFPRLKERYRQSAGTLSGGELQMLAIARALMGHPRVLLLDEPSLGLAPKLVAVIFETIQRVSESGTTILLVEQNAVQALRIAKRGVLLESGIVQLAGTSTELLDSSALRRAYLGG